MTQQHSPPSPQHAVSTSPTFVLGVDIGGTNLRLALADSDGTILARHSASTTGLRDPQLVIALITNGVETLLAETATPRSSLRSIAAGVPGITDVDAGLVIATSYLMGWRDVPFRDLLESALNLPAAIDNDVNLAALGESWLGAGRGTSDFVFIAIGTGVGAGIILRGEPFRGLGWTAGEIGYLLVPGTSTDPASPHQPGALESLIGGEGLRAQWAARWQSHLTLLPRDLHATAIFDAAVASTPDQLAASLLEDTARLLAFAVYNLTLVLDCSLFVLGGGVGTHPALLTATQRLLDARNARAHPRLVPSILGADAQLLGAIRLALNTVHTRPFLLP